MLFERECGLLLHPSSLPGPHGIGELGEDAERWLMVLHQAKQSLWQVLPLTPPSNAYSPYQSSSSFAGDTMLISLDKLAQEGLLEPLDRSALEQARSPGGRIHFPTLYKKKPPLLRHAASQLLTQTQSERYGRFREYCQNNGSWLLDYCRYQALRRANGQRPWFEWPMPLRSRQPAALQEADQQLAAAIEVEQALQFLFEEQWQALRAKAHELGIRIVGDVPIFVAHDSADVWAHQDLFQLNSDGQPIKVAGVPPDYFSKTGQRWGNPLFNWQAHLDQDFAWWRSRVRRTLETTDVIRIDHFRGFAACWEIPAEEPTAVGGQWVPAPGKELFAALQKDLGTPLPIIAEDLGIITDDVVELRDSLGLPTMRVLQFSFTGEEKLLPHHFPENAVVFTGTHDNDTTVGWYTEDPATKLAPAKEVEAERDRVRRYFNTDGTDIHWTCMKCVLESQASAAIIPAQDLMGLGSEARMNTPGTVGDHNWSWRFEWEQLTTPMIMGLRHLTQQAGRNSKLFY